MLQVGEEVKVYKLKDGDIFDYFFKKNDKKDPYRNFVIGDLLLNIDNMKIIVTAKTKHYKWYQFWKKKIISLTCKALDKN